ncbi:MAG: hypothetical protein MUC36_12230 [Planctomycetes bacterium]|jgi:hypothetical protein|nr:hypothetical protein [Planctomycetota bacterium]
MHPALLTGLCVAAVYAAATSFVIACERKPHRGGWISLNGIVSFFLTFPISWLLVRRGGGFDVRRNGAMLLAVGGTAILLAGLAALLVWPFCD